MYRIRCLPYAEIGIRQNLSVVRQSILDLSSKGHVLVTYLNARRSPASIGVGFVGLQQDDLGLQTDHLCEQRLLVVGERATALTLGVQFGLH